MISANCYALAMHQEKYSEQQFIWDVLKENQVSTSLIFSLSKIAPDKELLIPRLELLAALLGARSLNFVEKSLQLKIKKLSSGQIPSVYCIDYSKKVCDALYIEKSWWN